MKHRTLSPIALAALVIAFTIPVAAPAAPPPARSASSSTQTTHPEIRAAIASLMKAQVHLREATHDFGGHRVEALKATDEAVRQLQICLQYDK